MRIDNATRDDIRFVADRMRDSDFDEFSAVSFANDRQELADGLVARLSDRLDVLCAGLNEPICIGATQETRPGVISLLFFATDRFAEIGLPITRFIKANLLPRLIAAGAHRIETLALATNGESQAWLKTLGLFPETGPLRGYGKNGEEFVLFSWVKE